MAIKDFNMFDIVNKSIVLQRKFKIMKNVQNDKYNTKLYKYYTGEIYIKYILYQMQLVKL